jgi:hypothetical protein
MSESHNNYEIHSELSGGHWIAWVTTGGEKNPSGAVTLVGQTQEEAEKNARLWADRLDHDPRLLRE